MEYLELAILIVIAVELAWCCLVRTSPWRLKLQKADRAEPWMPKDHKCAYGGSHDCETPSQLLDYIACANHKQTHLLEQIVQSISYGEVSDDVRRRHDKTAMKAANFSGEPWMGDHATALGMDEPYGRSSRNQTLGQMLDYIACGIRTQTERVDRMLDALQKSGG